MEVHIKIDNNISLMPGKIFVCKINLRNFTYLFSRLVGNCLIIYVHIIKQFFFIANMSYSTRYL